LLASKSCGKSAIAKSGMSNGFKGPMELFMIMSLIATDRIINQFDEEDLTTGDDADSEADPDVAESDDNTPPSSWPWSSCYQTPDIQVPQEIACRVFDIRGIHDSKNGTKTVLASESGARDYQNSIKAKDNQFSCPQKHCFCDVFACTRVLP
jgi:hypothetical protein